MAQAAENLRVPPRLVGKYLVQITIVFVAYFAAGRLGQATTSIRSSNLGPVWPAYGIALAALLLYGYRVWVGIAAAAFLVAFLSPVPHLAAAGQAAGATLAALIGAFLLCRIAKFDSSLSRLRDALALIVLGALGSAMVSATIGVSVLYATHVQAYTGIGSAWLIYWLGDSTGVLLVTPLVLTAPNLLRIRGRVRIAELAALLLLLTLVCIIVVGDLPLIPVKLHFLAFAVLPFVIWAAIRFGVSGAALSTLIVAAIATVTTALGSGPFAQNTSFTNAVLLDVFFAVLSVSGLTLAAVIAEREKAESERERLVREQAAMEVRLRLATIVESSDDAIISKDLEEVIVSWNRGAQRIFGFTEAEAVGQPITIIIPPELQKEENMILQRLWAGESIEHYETIRVTKEGKKVNVSLMISPLKDSTGRIIGASKIARDITERKQTQDNLRESEERLRLAVETGRMYAFEWDPATDLIERSGECSDIFSWIDDSAHDTGKQFAARVHPDDRERYIATTETGLTATSPTYQTSYRVLRPDGSVTWLEESGRAFFDAQGKMLRAIGMGVDVSDRKQAELVLREGEERFRVVANKAPVMIWMAGTDKLCTYVNQPWLEFTGRPLEAELGNGWVESVHPEDLNRSMDTYTQAFDRRESFQMEYRLRRHDGEYRWLSDTGVPRFNPDHSFAGYIGSATDVTKRKLAEESLADVGRKLIEAHEEERTWIARELHDDVNQRMALLAIELDRWNQQLPPSAVELHDHIHHASQRLSDIAVDIQALSHRLHSSKLEYLGLVAAAKSFCKELSQQQKVEIDFSHTDIPRSVPKEISLCLFRVLQETLQNAVKHSGVRHFKVELCGTEREIQLTVSDLGVGFDLQEAIHRRGLGLISMRERMQLVGGEISFTSHPGGGTTIHARVPLRGTDSLLAVG